MKNILCRMVKRFCPKEKTLYFDEVDLDQFLSQVARSNAITANFLANHMNDIVEELNQSERKIAEKWGIEPDDFKIGALAAQQKTYF